MRIATFEGFGADTVTEADVSAAWSRLFGQADQLVAKLRYEYAKAGVYIGIVSNADLVFFAGAKRLVDWVADLEAPRDQFQANWKALAAAIDLWAGEQRDRVQALEDPAHWAQWADNGKTYLQAIAEAEQQAWDFLSPAPVLVAIKESLADLTRLLAAIGKVPGKVAGTVMDNLGLLLVVGIGVAAWNLTRR